MKRTSINRVFVLAAIAALVLGGVAWAQTPKEIIIGNIQDLSAANKAFGLGMTNAATALIEKVNAAGGIGGRKIKFISYDTKSDVTESINAYRRLVDQDQAIAILGPPISNQGIALAPIAEEKKVPIVGLFLDDRSTVKEDGTAWKFMYLAQNSASVQAKSIAAYAMNELKVTKFAMLYNQQNAYSVSLANPFKQYVLGRGGQILSEQTFTNSDKDYRAQLTKIKLAKPEAIYMPNYPQEIPLTLTQKAELGLKGITLGDNSFIPFALASSTDPSASEGVLFPNGIDPAKPELVIWAKTYKEKFGIDPVAQAYSGEDAMAILLDAIRRAGSNPTSVRIAEELEKTSKYPGLQGPITISPKTHQPQGLPMAILRIKDGKTTLAAMYTENGPFK